MPDSVNTCVYRLVQESLRNVVNHASAKCAWVKLRQTSTRIEVEIKDNGKGFAASTVKGLGLLGMEERVFQLGGKFEIQSKPGAGTTVHASLPIRS